MKPTLRPQGGFTLIELMTVVLVIGILSAIAFPSYQNQVRKGARAEAKAAMMKTAAQLERYYTDNNCYPSSASTCGTATTSALAFSRIGLPSYTGDASANSKYDMALTVTPQAFTITATPRKADPDCGNLTLTNTTAKAASTGSTTCW